MSGAGTYPAEVCDDYYGTTYSLANAIDNNCDGNANCADTSCRVPYDARRLPGGWKQWLGPQGSVCCSTNEQCKNFLSDDAFVECGDNKECDCLSAKAPDGENDRYAKPYMTIPVSNMLNFRTCVDKGTTPSFDRFINITGVTSGSRYTVSGIVKDINGGDECSEDVDIGVYLSASGPEDPFIILISTEELEREYTVNAVYFVIALRSREPVEDCLVSISVSKVPS